MDENGILMSHLMLELTNGLQEGLALNITDGATYFDDSDSCVLIGKIPVEPALDFIGDVGDNLYGASAVIATA